MARYRVLTAFVDLETGNRHKAGDIVTLRAARGETLAASGFVREIREQTAPETATKTPSETADRKRGKAKD